MNGPALLALQLLDSELVNLAGRRKRLPERVVVADAKAVHDVLVAERGRQQAIIGNAETVVEALEIRAAALDTKKARLEAQLKTVIAPREAEALMHEIATIDGHHSGLDDEELEAMAEQEQAEAVIAELERAEPAMLEALAEAQSALDAALDEKAAEELTLRRQRDAASAELSDDEQALYVSATASHGGVGFCRLERHTCTGCHVDLSQMEFEQANAAGAGELADCPHCGRYLVV